MPAVVIFEKSNPPPPWFTFIPSMSTRFMSLLPPRAKMPVVPPRLPVWISEKPGCSLRICSASVACRCSICSRVSTLTDEPVCPTGVSVFVAVTTTGSIGVA